MVIVIITTQVASFQCFRKDHNTGEESAGKLQWEWRRKTHIFQWWQNKPAHRTSHVWPFLFPKKWTLSLAFTRKKDECRLCWILLLQISWLRIGSAQCLERLLLAAATIFGNQLVNGAGKQLVGFLYLHLQWELISINLDKMWIQTDSPTWCCLRLCLPALKRLWYVFIEPLAIFEEKDQTGNVRRKYWSLNCPWPLRPFSLLEPLHKFPLLNSRFYRTSRDMGTLRHIEIVAFSRMLHM